MMKIKGNTRGMVYASAIAAIYVVLTLVSLGKFLESRNMQNTKGALTARAVRRRDTVQTFGSADGAACVYGRRGSGFVHRVRNSKSRHRRAAVGRGHRISCDADRRIPDIQVPEQA